MRAAVVFLVSAPVLATAAILWGAAQPLSAQDAQVSAEVAAGREIIAENNCNGSCHQARVKGADPLTLYTRTTRKVNSREELKRQVEMCVSALNAPIFPEDIDHVVSALDHDAYHFD